MNTINLKDKEYRLCFDFSALIQLEKILDKPFFEIDETLMSLTGMRALLFSGLQRYHSNEIISIEEIDKYIDMTHLSEIIPIVINALRFDLGQSDKDISEDLGK